MLDGDWSSDVCSSDLLEAFIVSNRVLEVIVVTMNLESTLSHPVSRIEMIPFERWALSDD
jgi:hypothetical protein